jgi:hypothetical protein
MSVIVRMLSIDSMVSVCTFSIFHDLTFVVADVLRSIMNGKAVSSREGMRRKLIGGVTMRMPSRHYINGFRRHSQDFPEKITKKHHDGVTIKDMASVGNIRGYFISILTACDVDEDRDDHYDVTRTLLVPSKDRIVHFHHRGFAKYFSVLLNALEAYTVTS